MSETEQIDGDIALLMDIFTDEERENILAAAGDDIRKLKELVIEKALEYEAAEQEQDIEEPEIRSITLQENDGESEDQALARYALMPEMNSLHSITELTQLRLFNEPLDMNSLVDELRNQVDRVKSGDLSRSEDMLVSQAHTLDRLFNKLILRASSNMKAGYLGASDTYLKLALKSQSQCKATWEAVSNIKNPSVVKANQINMAQNQQVNNHKNQPTELGDVDELPENSETPGIEQADGSQAQALEEIDRAEVTAG